MEEQLELCKGTKETLTVMETDLQEAIRINFELSKELEEVKERQHLLNGEPTNNQDPQKLIQIYRELNIALATVKKTIDEIEDQKQICEACHKNKKSCLLLPCKHLCICDECSVKDISSCPSCGQVVEKKVENLSIKCKSIWDL